MARKTNEELREEFDAQLPKVSKAEVYFIDDDGMCVKWPELREEDANVLRAMMRMPLGKSELHLSLLRGSAAIEEKMIPLARVCMISVVVTIGVTTEMQFWFPRGGGSRMICFVQD